MSTEIAIPTTNTMQAYCFSNAQAFEAAQRMATALSKATLIPATYQNNMPNCIIALEVAQRMGASPLMVMQNLYIVHGKPGWSSQFIISAINTCGKFKPLRFDLTGQEGTDERSCVAWTVEKSVDMPNNIRTLSDAKAANLPVLESPKITIAIAKKEGWFSKNGSKWQTMPELMLHYRSASFFGKLYAPEILMGMQTVEEVEDVLKDVTPPRDNSKLQQAFMENGSAKEETSEPKNKLDEILSTPKATKKEEAVPVSTGDKASPVAKSATVEEPTLFPEEKVSNGLAAQAIANAIFDCADLDELEQVMNNNRKILLDMTQEEARMAYDAEQIMKRKFKGK